ncbi:RNA-directed DNA polymerase, eukaryota [Tanacetum coccineum]
MILLWSLSGVYSSLMKGISLNCNGLGCANKKSWINGLIKFESPIFFKVQETKLGLVDEYIIRSLWPRSYVDYAFSSSLGVSGGILTVWDSRVFNLEKKITDRNFLAVMGSWAGSSSKVGLLNIYAPQASALKE